MNPPNPAVSAGSGAAPSGRSPAPRPQRWVWALPLTSLLALGLWVSFRYDAQPLQQLTGPLSALGYAGRLLPWLLASVALMGVLFWSRLRAKVAPVVSAHPASLKPQVWLQHFGAVAAFLFTTDQVFGAGGPPAAWAVAAWLLACLALALTGLNLAVPYRGMLPLLRVLAAPLGLGLLLGALAWTGGEMSGQLWEPMAEVTLDCVSLLLGAVGQHVVVYEADRVIRLGDFSVRVAPECSGYEGIGLIGIFLGAYVFRYRNELRFPAALGVPLVGIVAIWVFNVVRIAALVLIGAHVSGEIAVGGFHSKAGWVVFCAIAIGMIAIAHRTPFLLQSPRAARESASVERPAGPYLLPLIVMLAASLLTGLVTSDFDYLYPLRMLVVAAVALRSWRFVRPDSLKPTSLAVAAGLAVFGMWLALVPSSGEADGAFADALSGMSPGLRYAWLAGRCFGTALVIPVVEELAFRGFAMRRLSSEDFEHLPYRACTVWGLLGSSVAFGVLHSAWVAGILAGVAYGYLVMRTGRLYDAVIAHGLTNALLAIYALTTGHYYLL